ncbi:MAG: hypothetical protein DME23_18465 [Verrucomicrobia bacterium]|nr:MAG: hypothetical protein DME23_18465 [Verrucomicrobiota bacterium]
MKKILLVVSGMLVGAFGYAQGTVNFNTRVIPDVDVKVFDVDGTTPLAGTGFTAQLFGGPQGTATNSLAPIVPTAAFRTGAGAGYIVPTGNVPVAGVLENGTATLQLRVWDNMGGTITSYAQAVTSNAKHGASNAFDLGPLGGTLTTPPNLKGLLTFNLVVPEPSTIALGILGAAALLLRRRK